MNESQRIADQIRRAVHGDAWYGDGIAGLLKDVSVAQATGRPIPNTHTIWEIVLHITAWADIIGARLRGVSEPVTPDQDWPAMPAEVGDPAWNQAVVTCLAAHDRLAAQTQMLSESRLSEPITGDPPEIYAQLHGIVQHSLYHAGQISILKKFR
ncbi:MAG: DinB family protein [candidate division Zixibacteria bacterium]|nr:DinB family protein [candidate division Zixibacteria bacterium]